MHKGKPAVVSVTADSLLARYLKHAAAVPVSSWVKLFGEFVPAAWVPQLVAALAHGSQVVHTNVWPSASTCQELFRVGAVTHKTCRPGDVKHGALTLALYLCCCCSTMNSVLLSRLRMTLWW